MCSEVRPTLPNNWFVRNPWLSAVCISLAYFVAVKVMLVRLESEYLSGADSDRVGLLSYCAGVASGSVIPLLLPFFLRLFTRRPQVCIDDVRGRCKRLCASLWIIFSRYEFALFASFFVIEGFFGTQLRIPVTCAKEAGSGEAYSLLANSIAGLWNGVFLGFLVLIAVFKMIVPSGASEDTVPD